MDNWRYQMLSSLTGCSSVYIHFQKGKITFLVDVRYIGISSKTASSTCLIVELFLHRNVWKWALGGAKIVTWM